MDSDSQLKLGRESYPNYLFSPIRWRKKYAPVDRIYPENKNSVRFDEKPPSYANVANNYDPEIDHRPPPFPTVRLRGDEEERESWQGSARPSSASRAHYYSVDPVSGCYRHSSVHGTRDFSVVSRSPYVQIVRTRVSPFPEQPLNPKHKVRTYHLRRRRAGLNTYGTDQASLNGEILPFGTKPSQPVFRKNRPHSFLERKTASYDQRSQDVGSGQNPSQYITKLRLRDSAFRIPKLSRSLSEDLGYRREVQIIFVDELDRPRSSLDNSSSTVKRNQRRPVIVPPPVAHMGVQCQAERTEPVHTIVLRARSNPDTRNPKDIWIRGQQPSAKSSLELSKVHDAIDTHSSFPYILPIDPNRLRNVNPPSRSSTTPTPTVKMSASVQSRIPDYDHRMEESDEVATLTPDDSSGIGDDLYVMLDNDVFDPYEPLEPRIRFATQKWKPSPNATNYVKRVTIASPVDSASSNGDTSGKGTSSESDTVTIDDRKPLHRTDEPYVQLSGDLFCARHHSHEAVEVNTFCPKRVTTVGPK